MYRNTTVGSLPLGLSRRPFAQCCSLFACLMLVSGLALFGGLSLKAQSTSGGGIKGTVSDPSGAAVANATVTATNTDTGVATTVKSNGSGVYSIEPLQAGPYIVEVTARGFQRLLQENITVDNATMLGFNPKLTVGGENTTITVTDAPPFLDTTDATLGGTIENELYSQLPLSMNGGPRDPTAFQYLMPGVQENPAGTGNVKDSSGNLTTSQTNGNSGIYGGTGQTNLNENYVEGVPVSNINQQGSNNAVSSAVSVDAVDQFSVQTSGASSSFGGAGSTNYTIKSGGNQFHGSVIDFVRNTAFDTWGYLSKVPSASGVAVKPGEHQNQYDASIGGPIFRDKLFFFGDYSGFHYTKVSNTPQYITIPTIAERSGNFTDALGSSVAYMRDPTACSYTGVSTGGGAPQSCSFQGLLNGVPTYNVIPASEISPISQYLESALPNPTNLSTFSNYLASLPLQNADYSIDVRLDYTMNSRNKFSLVSIGGVTGYGGQPFYSNYTQLPVPYAAGQFTNQKTATGIFKYTFIASQTLINSLSYGYTRNWGQGFPLTGATYPKKCSAPGGSPGPCNSASAGILNLPSGNASDTMPSVSFTQDNGPQIPATWSSTSSTGPVATNSFSLIDNLQWIKGRHNVTFGAQIQWLETNGGSFGGYSKSLALQYHASTTSWCTQSSTVTLAECPTNFDGDAYAAFLVGAAYQGQVVAQSIADVGGRYRPMAGYVQDNWQVSSKLTLNLGLRYDYLQPYHEVKDRISFLNPTTINPIVGIPGVLEYAGFPNINQYSDIPATATSPAETAAQQFAQYAPYTCHCTTPVHPYNKNLEPRFGFSYAYTPTTVFSGAYSLNLTHAGGVGGSIGGSATTGPGNNNEFAQTTTVAQNGITGDPGFFLNPVLPSSPSSVAKNSQTNPQGTQNGATVAGNPLAAFPSWLVPGVSINPLSSTGNYSYQSYFADFKNDDSCQTNGVSFCTPGGVNFADPYYGGRGPQFISYNFSVQHMINKKAVLTVAYAGSQTHFLPGGAGRGYATNTYSPDYVQEYKNNLINGGYAGSAPPYPLYAGTNATVAQSLKPFPQFGTMTDIWGSTGNAAYNSLQVSVIQRPWHNLSGLMSYTRSKELDDTGNHRTLFPMGPQDGNYSRTYGANQVDRGLGQFNQTNTFNIAWNYAFPIGRGQAFFATNRIASLIGGGWTLNGIYKYRDGYPLQITATSCNPATNGGQGDPTHHNNTGICMPDYTPGFNKSAARINGRWGRGPGANAGNLNTISYLNPAAFQCPDSSPLNNTSTCGNSNTPGATWKIGNIGRSAPDGLFGPGWWDVDLGLRRTFNVRETATLHLTFQVEADVSNATNSVFFNLASSQWNSSTYGQVSGQNQQIIPRDWQFAGRLRF